MSILNYLDNQTVDPTTDGSVSGLDDHAQDEVIDLSSDNIGDLAAEWDTILSELGPDENAASDAEHK